jgi:hypothetical protein
VGHHNGQTTDPPARGHANRVTALLEPLNGLELGAHDRCIIDWLADWDTSTIGTIASLLYRARAISHDESTTVGARHRGGNSADNSAQ